MKEEITETEFFKKLSEKLQELFPKTNNEDCGIPSKGNRSQALVFNAFANIIHNEILEKEKKLQSARDYIVAEELFKRGWTFERYLNTLAEKINRELKTETTCNQENKE